MSLRSIYDPAVINHLSRRIDLLAADSKALWGSMASPQMLAHLNVMFELGMEEKHKAPNALVQFLLRSLVKKKVTNEMPYKPNSRTAPEMVIRHQPDFEVERSRAKEYLMQIEQHGKSYFEQKKHPSFGHLTATEWSNLFYKHIDHHLRQFSV